MWKACCATLAFFCAYGPAYGADATWVGDESTEIWDVNNWTSSEPNGTLTIGAGNPYDPIWSVLYPLAADNRVAKLNTAADANLTILGGTNYVWSSDYLNGQVRIVGGLLSIRGNAYVGRDGPATLTVNGGSFSYKYTLYLGYGTGGDATLNAFSGDVYFTGRPVIGSNGGIGRIYIKEGGSCYCGGDETVWFRALADAGTITTDPGLSVVVEYQSGYARTRISAQQLVGATLPMPWDEMEDVGITGLSWQAGTLATSSEVYFGTDAAAVVAATKADTDIYVGATSGVTMAIPYALTPGHTYYWRVDTVRADSFTKGNVWSFKAIAVIPPRRMEKLDRGVIAVRSGSSNYIGWRLMGNDPQSIAFNVYRGVTKVNPSPITDSTNYVDAGGATSDVYSIRTVINGQETETTTAVAVLTNSYYSIPVQQVPGDTGWTYWINDGAVGDLDGDGEYEVVVKRIPPVIGAGSIVMIEAYKLDGTFMWRVNMGPNFTEWEELNHIVYDFDSDGKAEIALKTSELTTFGDGVQIGDTDGDGKTDYSDSAVFNGVRLFMTQGPEFLSILEGSTGRELSRTNYIGRDPIVQWGLPSHNIAQLAHRSYKFHMTPAYLDGQRPSLVICRGIYHRIKMEAWNFRDGSLQRLWAWDSAGEVDPNFDGQGNHNFSVGDVDQDGKDEIAYGGCVIDDNGKGLYSTGLGHGDAMHLSDMDPCRPGLEIWRCLEGGDYGTEFRDAGTGANIIRYTAGKDTGRCSAGDIDPRYRGYELWGSTGCPLYSCDGTVILSASPSSMNFMIYWDGDLLRELLDHNWLGDPPGAGTGKIDKWDYQNGTLVNLLTAAGTYSNNYTKGNPVLQADIFGDWREEAIWRSSDNRYIRIYTTAIPTEYRMYTLMHDPQYRLAVAWQVCGYNQPPHPGFFLGDGMAPAPIPFIQLIDPTCPERPATDLAPDCHVNFLDYAIFAGAFASGDTAGPANFNGDTALDFRDLAMLAGDWLVCMQVPAEDCWQ